MESPCLALERLLYAFAMKWNLRKPRLRINLLSDTSVFNVEANGKTIDAHPSALITLVQNIWGADCLDTDRWLCVLPRDEVFEFARRLVPIDRVESKLLYIQNQGPYDAHLEQESWLQKLFPRPLKMSVQLETARSSGALLRRAIPFSLEGNTLDRVSALGIILEESAAGLWDDRAPAKLLTMLQQTSAQLQRETNVPALVEGGRLLSAQLIRVATIYDLAST